MSAEVRNAALAFVGGVLVLIVADGSYTHYVRPGAGPLVLAAGLVILALAVVDAVRHARGGSDEQHGAKAAWLMLLPVLTVLLVAPPSLGSDAVGLAGGRTAPTKASFGPLPPGPAPALAVVDFVSRAAARDGTLDGREVTLTGFLVGGDVARLVISCCAADASPVRVHLAPPPPAAAPGAPDRWVTVRGTLVPGTGTAADGHVPTLRVTSLDPVAAPDPAYEY